MSERSKKMIADAGKAMLAEAGDFITEMMPVLNDQDNKKIPENVFREIFMPYFTGQTQGTKDQDYLSHWIGVVGSASSSADVVDIQGNVVFTVPPLVDTDQLNTNSGIRYGAMLTELHDQARVHPGLAYPEFYDKAGKALDKVLGTDETPPNVAAWQKIYQYYGLAKAPEQGSPAEMLQRPLAEDFFE